MASVIISSDCCLPRLPVNRHQFFEKGMLLDVLLDNNVDSNMALENDLTFGEHRFFFVFVFIVRDGRKDRYHCGLDT